MSKNAYRGHRFPPAIIQLTVWMYARFTLSLRDVEELLAERGLDVSYETVRRWFLKFGQVHARGIRHGRHRPTDHWYFDEMVIVMGRRRFYSGGPWTARARSWISWCSVAGILERQNG